MCRWVCTVDKWSSMDQQSQESFVNMRELSLHQRMCLWAIIQGLNTILLSSAHKYVKCKISLQSAIDSLGWSQSNRCISCSKHKRSKCWKSGGWWNVTFAQQWIVYWLGRWSRIRFVLYMNLSWNNNNNFHHDCSTNFLCFSKSPSQQCDWYFMYQLKIFESRQRIIISILELKCWMCQKSITKTKLNCDQSMQKGSATDWQWETFWMSMQTHQNWLRFQDCGIVHFHMTMEHAFSPLLKNRIERMVCF